MIANVSARIINVIVTLLGPWQWSNKELIEEVRVACRDAQAAKAAVSRLRSELRGEVEKSPDVEEYRKVMPGPTPRAIPQKPDTEYRKGQSLAHLMEPSRR